MSIGSRPPRSPVREASTMLPSRAHLRAWSEARRHDLSQIERFVLFAGWPRSSHSLIGSLLTAHPDVAIAHELDALRYVDDHVTRQVLFGLLLARDRAFAEGGSAWTDYSYAVAGQWQGRYRSLRVIGDKKGGRTSQALHDDPGLLERLRETVRVPVQVIVVTRHPLDNIARMAVERSKRAAGPEKLDELVDRKIERFFTLANSVRWLSGETDVHWVVHEDFVAHPAARLADALRVLELEADDSYLSAAAGIVHESPKHARDALQWPPGRVEAILERSSQYAFLARYDTGLTPSDVSH